MKLKLTPEKLSAFIKVLTAVQDLGYAPVTIESDYDVPVIRFGKSPSDFGNPTDFVASFDDKYGVGVSWDSVGVDTSFAYDSTDPEACGWDVDYLARIIADPEVFDPINGPEGS